MPHDPAEGFLRWKHRVVYSLLRGAVRVSLRLQLPMDAVVELLRMAYFQEARDVKGLDLAVIAELFGKSLRTVSSLHHRYREDFFAPEREVAFRRELAAALAAGPRTRDELGEAFADRGAAELEAALADLVRDGRVLRADGRWHRNPEDHDFFAGADASARIDGLNRQVDILTETAWARLLAPQAPRSALARSYVFAATPDDFAALQEELLAFLRARAIAVDAAAHEQGVHNRTALTLAATVLEDEP